MTFTISYPILIGIWFGFGLIGIVTAMAFMCRTNKVSPQYTFAGYVLVVVVFFMSTFMVKTVMEFADALVKLGVLK